MVEIKDGVGLHEVVIPVVCFAICIGFQSWEFAGPHKPEVARARALFRDVRAGWITDNYMKGQAAVNTTRDYIRAALFFANTAILLTTFAAGYAGSRYTDCSDDGAGCTANDWLFVIKLGGLSALLMTIFFVFTQCTRYAVHFSFCINTRKIGGVTMPPSLMVKVFNHAHKYYSLGIRLYFGTIPVFAWLFTAWALLAVTPLYVYMVRGLENAGFVQAELDDLTRLRAELRQPSTASSRIEGSSAAAAAPGSSSLSSAAAPGAGAAVIPPLGAEVKQHVV